MQARRPAMSQTFVPIATWGVQIFWRVRLYFRGRSILVTSLTLASGIGSRVMRVSSTLADGRQSLL